MVFLVAARNCNSSIEVELKYFVLFCNILEWLEANPEFLMTFVLSHVGCLYARIEHACIVLSWYNFGSSLFCCMDQW
jgi:hypothetical protein